MFSKSFPKGFQSFCLRVPKGVPKRFSRDHVGPYVKI